MKEEEKDNSQGEIKKVNGKHPANNLDDDQEWQVSLKETHSIMVDTKENVQYNNWVNQCLGDDAVVAYSESNFNSILSQHPS